MINSYSKNLNIMEWLPKDWTNIMKPKFKDCYSKLFIVKRTNKKCIDISFINKYYFSSQEIMQVGVLKNSLSIRQKTLSMIELICCTSSLFSFGKGASAPLELEGEL